MKKAFLIASLLFLFACGNKNNDVIDNDGDPVVSVNSDDPEMNTAIEKARSSYEEFLTAFRNSDSTTRDYYIKMKFGDSTAGDIEHMWMGDLFFRDEKLFGVLSSDPVFVKQHKTGDTLEVEPARLSDWSYVKNDKLIGGYTILVLYRKMSEKEKAEFREMVDYTLE